LASLLALFAAFFDVYGFTQALSDGQSVVNQWGTFLFWHILACLFAILSYKLAYQKVPATNRFYLMIFILALSFFIPVLGIAFILIMMLLTDGQVKKSGPSEIQTMSIPVDYKTLNSEHSHFGAGGACARLKKTSLPLHTRTEALLALADKPELLATELMQKILNDDAEQLRLLAFSLLDKTENDLNEQIAVCKAGIHDDMSAADKSLCYGKLAQLHWEFVYRGLVKSEMRTQSLARAERYALKAVELDERNIKIYVLLGRIHLAQERYQDAKADFVKAAQKKVAPSKVLPYLTAIYYHDREFAVIKELLRQNPHLKDIPKFGPVVDFWRAKQ
jgi:hypothetical protein